MKFRGREIDEPVEIPLDWWHNGHIGEPPACQQCGERDLRLTWDSQGEEYLICRICETYFYPVEQDEVSDDARH